LRNWLAFLTLRMDPAAQLEIREFAGAVAGIISDRFPQTYRLFCEYK
jgi:thymidylate synthase ThyX